MKQNALFTTHSASLHAPLLTLALFMGEDALRSKWLLPLMLLRLRRQGKKSMAMEAYARALRKLPAIVADNGGYDSSELVTGLRAAHAEGKCAAGLDMYAGTVGDMGKMGVRESFKSKLMVLMSASEAAEMILRVDDIIKSAPRQRSEQY
mmetsp:Transcript_5944/g.12632  ORF Transcript_5944/g.12632 Transcript_5944/m.12632 type:complete len:150 (+) Transcript_5944:1632-2081(+)